MINRSTSYSGVSIADFVLFLMAVPFGVCDIYYSFKEFSCVWLPINNYKISFTLQLWLKIDGAVLLGMAGIILLCGLIMCCTSSSGFFWFHNMLTWLLALFRIAWLVIGSLMFWGYLNRGPLCQPSFTKYMWANLIAGFVISLFYLLIPCICGLTAQPSVSTMANRMNYGTGTNIGLGSVNAMHPLPPVTPSVRQSYSTKFIY